MRVFVTGGTGFVGGHLVKVLKDQGDTLLLLCRQPDRIRSLQTGPNVDVLEGDLSDINSWKGEIEKFSPEVTVHLAWEGIPDYGFEMSVKNLINGLNLLTMLADTDCKSVISTGSCWEYGQQAGEVAEDTKIIPNNAFTAAKNSLHWMGREIARGNKMNFVWTRLFYVYGPGQRETSLIPHIINCVRDGNNPELKTPSASNDFIYVEDVTRAIIAIIKNPPEYGVYNIGSGSATSVKRIAEIVCEKFNVPCEINVPSGDAENPVFNLRADISKIVTGIGWEPEVSVEEGIQRMIDSFLGGKVDEQL